MSSVRPSSQPLCRLQNSTRDRAADRAAVEDQARAREQRAEQVVAGLVPVLDDPPQPRADDAADDRGEDELVGPVDRLADLLQVARGQRPADDEGDAEHQPEGLQGQAEEVQLGLHVSEGTRSVRRSRPRSGRAPRRASGGPRRCRPSPRARAAGRRWSRAGRRRSARRRRPRARRAGGRAARSPSCRCSSPTRGRRRGSPRSAARRRPSSVGLDAGRDGHVRRPRAGGRPAPPGRRSVSNCSSWLMRLVPPSGGGS